MNDLTPDGCRRKEFVAGLRELADYLEANPDVPDNGGFGTRIQYSVSVWFKDEADGIAEVNRVAEVLKVGPYWTADRTQYTAELSFGPHSYAAVWCRPDEAEPKAGA